MKSRIRLAFVHHFLPLGGVETCIFQLCKYLDREIFDIEVVLFQEGGVMVSAFQDIEIPVDLIPVLDGRGGFDQNMALALVEKLSKFDIAHSWYGGGVPHIGIEAVRLAKVPGHIQTVAWTVPAVFRHLDAIVMQTEEVKKIQEEAGIETPMFRINPGIDLERFDPEKVRPEITFEGPVVGRVSRLVSEKDPETFIRAAAMVHKIHPEVSFLVVGDGPIRSDLEALARGLEVKVCFYGETSLVPELLAAMDIFSYTTFGDSFGWVNVEAMAMAKPVISSRVGAIPEIIEEGVSGFLVSPGNVEEVAESICYLLEHPNEACQMGKKGRQIVKQNFDLKREIALHEDLYKNIYNKKSNRSRKDSMI